MLAARIKDKQEKEAAAKTASTRKSLIGSGDRSERIRTYNFPQGRVTDHRINLTLYKIERIMDGELDDVVNALAAEHQAEQLAQLSEKGGVTRLRKPSRRRASIARKPGCCWPRCAVFPQASLAASPEQEIPFEVENAFLRTHRGRKAGRSRSPTSSAARSSTASSLSVNPSVLIPRPETELLVDLALEQDAGLGARPGHRLGRDRAGDQAVERPHAGSSRSMPISRRSLTAQRNAAKLNLEIDFRHGRWFEPVAGERFELIVSNPPYVAEGDPHLPALRLEPPSALLAGRDGLDCIRDISKASAPHLLPGGWLLLEHGAGQDGAVKGAARRRRDSTRSELARPGGHCPRSRVGKV